MIPLALHQTRLNDPAHPFLIAEAASTHQQEKTLALELVHAAAEAGADAIKFQTYTADELCSATPIPGRNGQTLRDVLAAGGLPRVWHAELQEVAHQRGLIFLSTPFSVDAARFLVNELHVPALKIASGDLLFAPLLQYVASTGLPLLVSTGAATLSEVQATVAASLLKVYQAHHLTLFHCVSAYPCPPEAANLRAITTLKTWFPYAAVGWSDHTLSVTTPAIAVALGATVIEKHFCLRRTGNRSMDAPHSLEPEEFAAMCREVRAVHALLGTGIKAPQLCEQSERQWARRGNDGLRPTDAVRGGG